MPILNRSSGSALYPTRKLGAPCQPPQQPHALTAQTPDPRRWAALAVLAVAQFMVVLDASIVNVALPSIQSDLGFSRGEPAVGRQRLHARVRRLPAARRARWPTCSGAGACSSIGLGLFSVASLLGGFATTEGQLIAARGVQGLGAAIVSPAALSIVTTTFTEGAERNKALGIWGALAGAGGAVGVLMGGMLTEWAGWEWVLFVNVPIGLAAAVARAALRAREPQARERTSLRRRWAR